MSPQAVGLAVVLHVLAALLLWWVMANRPVITPQEEPVEITMERPKPPDPPPPEPPPKPQPKVEQVPIEGLRPPAEEEADRRTQRKPTGDAPKDIAGPPPESLEREVPAPAPPPPPPQIEAAKPAPAPPPAQPEGPKPAPPQVAMARPEAVPPAAPAKPAEQPAPSPAKPSTPTVTTIQPQQRPPPPVASRPPPSASLSPQIRPSPLVSRPQQQPPAIAGREQSQPSSPFVNPADERNRALAQDNYLWQVISRLRGYRYHANVPVREGLTVVQIVIARDGRLLEARVVSSSGIPEMDQGVLAGVRQGSPYTPLPPSLKGASATFRLPLVSVPDRQ